MAECTDQRQQCQALLAQLKHSQSLMKQQLLSSTQSTTRTDSLGHLLTTTSSSLGERSAKPQTGILKTSSTFSRSLSAEARSRLNRNNSATIDKSNWRSTSRPLPQGTVDSAQFKDTIRAEATYSDNLDRLSRDMGSLDMTKTQETFDQGLIKNSRSGQQLNAIPPEFPINATSTGTGMSSSADLLAHHGSEALSLSPTRQNWRQILNKHITVPSQLSSTELRELENERGLNFSYSGATGDREYRNPPAQESFKRQALAAEDEDSTVYGRSTRTAAVCKDITNKPVSVSISDMVSKKNNQDQSGNRENKAPVAADKMDENTSSKRVKFFRDQLEDDGNNRKLNSFVKDATIKPKSLLNSTAYRSLCPSKQSETGSELTAEDQRLLGYDWIAALLDNESGLVNQSESFFNELKDFRRAYKSECSNQFYRETPHNLVEFEPEPVAEALAETKVHPYIVNERLFTQPFKNGLIDYEEDETEARSSGLEKKSPTEENPRFVRVSIPRSTLSTPYKVKPHRRRSFDGSDSCALMDHCLLGWENTRPAMIPTAKSLDLNTEAGTRIDSQVTTLSEAERLATKYSQSEWPFLRPTARTNVLPTWRKHYMDTTLNLSRISLDAANASTHSTATGSGGAAARDVKRSTDRILSATYSAMYEMERLRKARELEMLAAREGQ